MMGDIMNLSDDACEQTFVLQVFHQLANEDDSTAPPSTSTGSSTSTSTESEGVDNIDLGMECSDGSATKGKPKRRSNLTQFTDAQTTKRKNEAAKRELTSIVTQLRKINNQLNIEGEEPRASINFIAKFNSFKSNRLSTFKFPANAEVKQTLMNYETTMSAVKQAVKEAIGDVVPRQETTLSVSNVPSDALVTPTKAISSFTAIPSPVASNKMLPSSSKNLCGKNSCTFGKRLRKPVWVKCSYRSEDTQMCNYWVHAPCIGFPNLTDDKAKFLEGWCCPDHTETKMKRK